MSLFGVDIAGIVTANLRGRLLPATLHKMTATVGAYGETSKTEASHNGEGVRLKWKSSLALERGYPLDAVKILLLADGFPKPTKEDEVVIMGDRYRIIDVETDPVEATWVLAGVLLVPGADPVIPPDAEEW
jgi:hypothetical protein